MPARILSLTTQILLLTALLAAACAPVPQDPALAATINRDCGPADGPAFTLTVPMHGRGEVRISIWKPPRIAGRAQFLLRESTDTQGSANLFVSPQELIPLAGSVVFDGVDVQRPVYGSFRFMSPSGDAIQARFAALWTDLPVYCG